MEDPQLSFFLSLSLCLSFFSLLNQSRKSIFFRKPLIHNFLEVYPLNSCFEIFKIYFFFAVFGCCIHFLVSLLLLFHIWFSPFFFRVCACVCGGRGERWWCSMSLSSCLLLLLLLLLLLFFWFRTMNIVFECCGFCRFMFPAKNPYTGKFQQFIFPFSLLFSLCKSRNLSLSFLCFPFIF